MDKTLVDSGQQPPTARFGAFDLDLRTAELRRNGGKVRLQEQPFRLLAVLVERAGDMVTREELRRRLWPAEFVDFDHSLNVAVRKLRESLGDSAEKPRFIETLARRGYRFIAPVSWSEPRPPQRRMRWRAGVAAAFLLVAAGAGAYRSVRPRQTSWNGAPYAVAVLPFTNEDGGTQYLNDGLTEILIDTLSRFSGIRVMARDTVFESKAKSLDSREAGRSLHVNGVIAGVVRRENDHFVIHVELIDVRDGAQVWGDRFTASITTLPAVYARITQALADHLWQRNAAWRVPHEFPADPRAYDLYLQGRYAWKRHDVGRAVSEFREALARDPGFAAEHSGLSYAVMIASRLLPRSESGNIVAAANRFIR